MTENSSKDAGFEQGPHIDGRLVAWLDTNVEKRIFQMPVDIIIGTLGIKSSYLSADNTKIEIELDTGAMSLDLLMHLKPYCISHSCRVWLEGTWGALISINLEEGLPIFAVRRVIGVADKQDVTIRFPKKQ